MHLKCIFFVRDYINLITYEYKKIDIVYFFVLYSYLSLQYYHVIEEKLLVMDLKNVIFYFFKNVVLWLKVEPIYQLFIRLAAGGGLHPFHGQQQLVHIPEVARHFMRAPLQDIRTCLHPGRGGGQVTYQQEGEHGHRPAPQAQTPNRGRGLLSGIPGHGEESARRQHGGYHLRGHATRDVRHTCLHCLYLGQGDHLLSEAAAALRDGEDRHRLFWVVSQGTEEGRCRRPLRHCLQEAAPGTRLPTGWREGKEYMFELF